MEKKTKVQPIPEGMNSVTPYLDLNDAAGFIKFLQNAFGGKLTYIYESEGKIMHSCVDIGNSTIMIADALDPDHPKSSQFYFYVEDVDSVYQKALDTGAISIREPINEFYGDRSAGLIDPWNNTWWIATHIEDVSEEEMRKREEEFRQKQAVEH